MIRIDIETGNAAFYAEKYTEVARILRKIDNRVEKYTEVARILRKIADRCEESLEMPGGMYDFNGNKVATITEDGDDEDEEPAPGELTRDYMVRCLVEDLNTWDLPNLLGWAKTVRRQQLEEESYARVLDEYEMAFPDEE